MAQNKIYESYSQLPTWAKGVVATLGIGTIIIVSVVSIKGIKKLIAGDSGSSAVTQANDDLKNLSNVGVKPSYTDTQYASWSEKLAFALAWVTHEDEVYAIMNYMKNEADILRLIQIFGTREVETFPFVRSDATLSEAIISSMNQTEVDNVNKILASKGIKFRF